MAVTDIEVTREQLVARGIDASEVFHCENGTACRFPDVGIRGSGFQPERLSYSSFVSFTDPDGNEWTLQEVTKRLPCRLAGNTSYSSAQDLTEALNRAAKARGKHEEETGQPDPKWPVSYAEYMVSEQSGE